MGLQLKRTRYDNGNTHNMERLSTTSKYARARLNKYILQSINDYKIS
jgi:hypothetical protein